MPASPTPRLPVWASEEIVGATPYALPTPGQLYRGLTARSPTPPPAATPTPRRTPTPAPRRLAPRAAALPPFGGVAGVALMILSAALAGYQRLIRRAAPPSPDAPDPRGAIEDDRAGKE